MTKYVLNSGGIKNSPNRGKKFFDEVFKGLGTNPRLLICVFAQPREDWEEKFNKDTESFRENFNAEVTPVLELAYPEKFEEQISQSDALYIHGGDDHLLLYWLKKFDLPRIWEEKVIATSSASSHALSEYFWTCDWRQCMDGLGLLPIKFLAHFESEYGTDDSRGPIDWGRAYDELKKYKDTSLPIHALREGKYSVLEV